MKAEWLRPWEEAEKQWRRKESYGYGEEARIENLAKAAIIVEIWNGKRASKAEENSGGWRKRLAKESRRKRLAEDRRGEGVGEINASKSGEEINARAGGGEGGEED